MLIVMSGLPGTGKSTLAQALGQRLRIPVFSVDPVESALLRAGLKQSFETGLAAYLVVEVLADAQLALGLDAIVDAVNAEEAGKNMWRALAHKHNVTPTIIECCCSDVSLHQERVRHRQRGLEGLPEPTWEDIQKRQTVYTSWAEPVISVDAVSSMEANLHRVLACMAAGPDKNDFA